MFAYLDPGTGSVIVQALIGGALGIAVAGKSIWHFVLGLFGKRKQSKDLRGNTNAKKADK